MIATPMFECFLSDLNLNYLSCLYIFSHRITSPLDMNEQLFGVEAIIPTAQGTHREMKPWPKSHSQPHQQPHQSDSRVFTTVFSRPMNVTTGIAIIKKILANQVQQAGNIFFITNYIYLLKNAESSIKEIYQPNNISRLWVTFGNKIIQITRRFESQLQHLLFV